MGRFKLRIGAAILVLGIGGGLGGCAQFERVVQGVQTVGNVAQKYSVTQDTLDGLRSAYVGGFLVPAANYAALGRCPAGTSFTLAKPCASPSVLRKLKVTKDAIKANLDNAQAQLTAGNSTGAAAAFSTAQSLFDSGKGLLTSLGVLPASSN